MSPRYLLLVDAGNSALKFQCHRIITPNTPTSVDVLTSVLAQTKQAPIVRLENHDVTAAALQTAWQQAASVLDAELGANASPNQMTAPRHWQISWSAVGPKAVMDAVAAAFSAMSDTSAPPAHQPVKELRLPASAGIFLNRYANPQQLGADRWISAIGLAALASIPPGETHMIVSAGTATTIDLIRACGTEQQPRYEFLGGWIFPGVALMAASLRQGTRDLQLTIDGPCVTDAVIPNDTRAAISQGIGLAQTAWLSPLVKRFDIQGIWLHGGAAGYWQEALRLVDSEGVLVKKICAQPNLIFAGLMALAQIKTAAA